MTIGYARVSTKDQDLSLQLDALDKAGCASIFKEKVTGSKRERPQLKAMLAQLRSGDVVVVWKKKERLSDVNRILRRCTRGLSGGGKSRVSVWFFAFSVALLVGVRGAAGRT